MISSHLLSLVEDLCTSVLLLVRGRKVIHGKLADLRSSSSVDGRAESLEELFFRLTEVETEPGVDAAGSLGPPRVEA